MPRMSKYPIKTVTLEHKGEILERVIDAKLDKVYLTDNTGEISVYYETDQSVGRTVLFKRGKLDHIAKEAKRYA